MQQLTYMVTFARVAQAGSFAGGARRLGLTTSAASKHIAKLERALSAKLLNRSTRALSLTEAGHAYLAHCTRVADEFDSAERAVTRLQARPAGRLRVSVPPAFVTRHVVPHLPEFHRRFPDVRIEFDASNRMVDLAEDGFDLALRIVRTPPPALAARPLAQLRAVLCAAPAYLKLRGTPRRAEDLTQHDCLTFTQIDQWAFRRDGTEINVPVQSLFDATALEPLRLMALEGLGVTQMPTFLVGDDLQHGRLQRLLPDHELLSETTLYAIHLPQPYLPPKLRCFIDFLASRYAPAPYWDQGLFGAAPAKKRPRRSG
ncbi:MAG: LysR family transcriptional regulator [Pseudomonadota bacterium]